MINEKDPFKGWGCAIIAGLLLISMFRVFGLILMVLILIGMATKKSGRLD